MTATDDEQIQELVRHLDETVPRDGHVEVLAEPDEPDGSLMRANRRGYLRLGIELLKAADAPAGPSRGRDLVHVDFEYIAGLEDCNWSFERREDVWSPISTEEPQGTPFQMLGGLLALFLVLALPVGAFTILQSLAGLFAR